MEDISKQIYEEYLAAAGQRGIMTRLAKTYGLSRQRIFAIVQAGRSDNKQPAAPSFILTDDSIDFLVELRGMTGENAPQIVETALAQYIEYLHQQAEYTQPKEIE